MQKIRLGVNDCWSIKICNALITGLIKDPLEKLPHGRPGPFVRLLVVLQVRDVEFFVEFVRLFVGKTVFDSRKIQVGEIHITCKSQRFRVLKKNPQNR